MHELMLILANALPFEEHMKRLTESVTEYNLVPTEENKRSVVFNCMLMMTHAATEKKDIVDVIKDVTHMRKLNERFQDEKISS